MYNSLVKGGSSMKTLRWYRIWRIVTLAVSIFFELYVFQRQVQLGKIGDVATAWERLVVRQAERFRKRALHLEGMMIKLGQFMSARADVMPDAFTDVLKDLIDRVPPAPRRLSIATLEREWNVPWTQVLRSLADAPAASASIADVYKAVLPDGSLVAVKIRRPQIAAIMDADFAALRIVIWLTKRFTPYGEWVDLDELYREFSETTLRELDFRREREHALQFAAMMSKYELPLSVPRYEDAYCTEQVLLMEWIEGASVADAAWLERHRIAPASLVPPLIEWFFVQLLEEGFFHADPHPGNLLVTADGRLTVIDFGMVGSLRAEARIPLRSFLYGFVRRDIGLMADAFRQLGFLRQGAEPLDLQHIIGTGMDYFLNKDFKRVDEQTMVETLRFVKEYVTRQPLQMPIEYAFLGRTVSILSGVLAKLQPGIDYLEAVRPAVRKWIEERRAANDPGNSAERPLFPLLETIRALGRGALRRLQEFGELPALVRTSLQRREWSDYYAQKLRVALVGAALSGTLATVSFLFTQPWLAAGSALISLIFIFKYKKADRQWSAHLRQQQKGE
jgi:predicted unusual protein kinase regulating ubiquinone biosynthesis (AarF/ABC1/UbiB family)